MMKKTWQVNYLTYYFAFVRYSLSFSAFGIRYSFLRCSLLRIGFDRYYFSLTSIFLLFFVFSLSFSFPFSFSFFLFPFPFISTCWFDNFFFLLCSRMIYFTICKFWFYFVTFIRFYINKVLTLFIALLFSFYYGRFFMHDHFDGFYYWVLSLLQPHHLPPGSRDYSLSLLTFAAQWWAAALAGWLHGF